MFKGSPGSTAKKPFSPPNNSKRRKRRFKSGSKNNKSSKRFTAYFASENKAGSPPFEKQDQNTPFLLTMINKIQQRAEKQRYYCKGGFSYIQTM